MSDLILTKKRLFEGVWEGVLHRESGASDTPAVLVSCQQEVVPGVEVTPLPDGAGWALYVPVPARMISDGVQTFLIMDKDTNEGIGHFTLVAGEALAQDIRVEVSLLREELDMLKKAFRRHCLETM